VLVLVIPGESVSMYLPGSRITRDTTPEYPKLRSHILLLLLRKRVFEHYSLSLFFAKIDSLADWLSCARLQEIFLNGL